MIIIMMGVSGAGKSTVGRVLADRLQCKFFEGDDYHTPESLSKMSAAIALTDEDREPWLDAVCQLILQIEDRKESAVIACSALKERYRERLRRPGVHFVYLDVPREELLRRLQSREGHFMGPELLDSQLQTLEKPIDALVVDGTETPEAIARRIEQRIV